MTVISTGMLKLRTATAQSALAVNLPNPWLKAYVEDVPGLVAEVDRLRLALRRIQQLDCLNPPDADHLWLRQLVDEALSPA